MFLNSRLTEKCSASGSYEPANGGFAIVNKIQKMEHHSLYTCYSLTFSGNSSVKEQHI